jgi:hypothetical protein
MVNYMGDGEQVYLAKPGGQREGPYTLEQIKRDLEAETYSDTDYWAWRDGLPGWVPLYEFPGLSRGGGADPAAAADPAAKPPKDLPEIQLASGMPFAALERIFLFTTGDGPAAWHAPEFVEMLEVSVGADIATIRNDVPKDIIGHCAVTELLKQDGSLSEAAWRVMASHQPNLVQQARERLLRVCIRTFRIGTGMVAAMVLFYNKQKL